MEPGVSMPHSQGIYSNPYPETNQSSVEILKEFLLPSIMATCPARLSLLDLRTLAISGEWFKLRSSSL